MRARFALSVLGLITLPFVLKYMREMLWIWAVLEAVFLISADVVWGFSRDWKRYIKRMKGSKQDQ